MLLKLRQLNSKIYAGPVHFFAVVEKMACGWGTDTLSGWGTDTLIFVVFLSVFYCFVKYSDFCICLLLSHLIPGKGESVNDVWV